MAAPGTLPAIPAAELDEQIPGREAAWDGLRGARVLLTGGTGFMGTWILELFCRANRVLGLGARVAVLSRHPAAFAARSPHLALDPAVVLREGDVRGFPPLGEPFTHVIHGAAASHGPLQEPWEYLDTLVEGTRRVLREAAAAGARRFLLLSSGAVYGPQPGDLPLMPETFTGAPDPLAPGTTYAQGKRMAEHVCSLFAERHGLAVVSARGFAFAGPHLPLEAHFAFGNFLRDGLRGGPIQVQGDGTPVRSYLYGAEMAAWIWVMLAAGRPGRAYNLGSDQPLTIAQLAQLVAQRFGTTCRIAREPIPGAAPARYVPSVLRAQEELGLVPRIDVAEAIRRTADWHRS